MLWLKGSSWKGKNSSRFVGRWETYRVGKRKCKENKRKIEWFKSFIYFLAAGGSQAMGSDPTYQAQGSKSYNN